MYRNDFGYFNSFEILTSNLFLQYIYGFLIKKFNFIVTIYYYYYCVDYSSTLNKKTLINVYFIRFHYFL